MSSLPDWMQPVVEGSRTIQADQLTRFVPPDDFSGRTGAVLMLFADREIEYGIDVADDLLHRGEILLTERSHTMRSHPGQVSFPGGGIDPGETPAQAALREAYEEVGLDASGVEVFGQLPELWLPPSNYAVTPVLGWWRERTPVRIASPAEVEAIHHVSIAELMDPDHRISVRHPSGWKGPAFLIGEDKDVVLWGFTAGIISRLFDHLGWTLDWDSARERDLPAHMLQGEERNGPRPAPNTRFEE